MPLSESPFISDVPSLLPSGMMTRSASPNPTGSRSTVKLEEDGAKARPRGLSPEDEHAQTERDQRKPPEWLVSGIFFDLAYVANTPHACLRADLHSRSWTTTFSSLTSNTPITTMGVCYVIVEIAPRLTHLEDRLVIRRVLHSRLVAVGCASGVRFQGASHRISRSTR